MKWSSHNCEDRGTICVFDFYQVQINKDMRDRSSASLATSYKVPKSKLKGWHCQKQWSRHLQGFSSSPKKIMSWQKNWKTNKILCNSGISPKPNNNQGKTAWEEKLFLCDKTVTWQFKMPSWHPSVLTWAAAISMANHTPGALQLPEGHLDLTLKILVCPFWPVYWPLEELVWGLASVYPIPEFSPVWCSLPGSIC